MMDTWKDDDAIDERAALDQVWQYTGMHHNAWIGSEVHVSGEHPDETARIVGYLMLDGALHVALNYGRHTTLRCVHWTKTSMFPKDRSETK